MDLFDQNYTKKLAAVAPLADRMRPRTLTEFFGQGHILGPGKPLRKLIISGNLSSLIFWGPPGSGKTTLAHIIAGKTKSAFIQISAVTSNLAEVREIIKKARETFKFEDRRTILFIDEIHRFNKAQQDAFLPHVEKGTIILIGATTENPSFEINSPLISRSQVFKLNPLDENDLRKIIEQALQDKERGLGKFKVKIEKDAIEYLATQSGGDGRVVLNALEMAATVKKPDRRGVRNLTPDDIREALMKKTLQYDRVGDMHYDTISAFIKSIRGSDPDAALHYLSRMIEAGEDPRFIARRMVILASEDIGNADPIALLVANAAAQAVEYVGLPEAQLNLAQATTYLATAPKSNASYLALLEALADVKEGKIEPIPLQLRNAPTDLMRELGYSKGYKYAHKYEGGWAKMEFMPKLLKGKRYYQPKNIGFEKKIRLRIEEIKARKRNENQT